MTTAIPWDLYRSFLAVLQEGSLSGAARALGLTQPTLGRQVAALEQQLGVALFTRSQTGLAATDAATALRGHIEAMHSIAASLERVASGLGENVRGAVRVSASEVMGIEWLPPILARLRQTHPELEIELVLSNRVQDLVQREVDIAVRMTPPRQDVLLATRVGSVTVGLHAHRDYLARKDEPASVAELAQHDLIGFDLETPFIRAAGKGFAQWRREAFALRCDSDLGQLALLRAAAGIGFCQHGVARRDAQLQALLPQISIELPTWVAMHTDLRNSPRCKVVFDALASGLRALIG
ncbi:LysR family transcriptional regulator [Uliginosibacterium sp. 31-12]|uniref:LysR family transcriptional regulator n=1 Tax=Uliginosibacterium sp. 31-12 TaxID=3062781 RepID=UPI0026E3B4A9|nr:LysR family transcriptional regulator [Uliginosibacterium sp. 31-12]MDO6387326.1 LysR family transcriptional regulator [Uliginosibacterium sp. 31-12]